MKPWDKIIPEKEQDAYRAAGFGKKSGYGKSPALLIIDVQYRTTGTKPMEFWESIKEFPTSCGSVAWDAVKNIEQLLKLFRNKNWPIIYPHVAPKKNYDAGTLAAKIPNIMNIPENGYEFVKSIAPKENDILVPKRHPSAFFGTSLASYLVDLKCDTLVMSGCTTSGCIRSSVVDAFSLNYKVLVPEDGVYDRSSVSHAVNLFDISEKYADVFKTFELVNILKKIN